MQIYLASSPPYVMRMWTRSDGLHSQQSQRPAQAWDKQSCTQLDLCFTHPVVCCSPDVVVQMWGKSSPHKPGTPTRRTNSRKVGADESPVDAGSQSQENGNGTLQADEGPDSPVKPLDKQNGARDAQQSRDVEAGDLDVVSLHCHGF